MKKLFISMPMHGYSEDEVNKKIEEIKYILTTRYNFPIADVEIIDNYHHPDAPEDAGRLWHLGRSIQQMQEADYVYFAKNSREATGCEVELTVAMLYGLEIINFEDYTDGGVL